MSKQVRKYISGLLAAVTVFSAVPPTVTTASPVEMNVIEQQVWLTEIYNNDIARNELYTGLSGATIDSMDYIEVYNASDAELDFGASFELIYNETSDHVLTFNEAEILIPAQSTAVFWVRRVDLESKGTMPDEAAFRASNNIPADVPVFSVNNQKALKNTTATISILSKSSSEVISTYTYDTSDVGSMEGTSVHLQAVAGASSAISLAKQATPSAGQVSEAQKTVLTKAILTAGGTNRISSNEAVVSFTSSQAGSYYYAVAEKGASAPSIDTTGSGAVIDANVEAELALTALAAGAKDIYIVVKDEFNQVSEPLKLELADFMSNNAVYLTEIFPNDIPRDDQYTALSGPTIDSMDYIEVYNASDVEMDFGAHFNLVYTDISVTPIVDKPFTYNEAELNIPAQSAAVFWVRRVDLESKGTMPDEAAFRASNNIPDHVPVFSINNQTALRNTTATISIVAKNNNETISTYTYTTADAGSKEGTSVHLQAAEGMSGSLAIAKQAAPTAGQVSDVQKTVKPDPGVVPELSILDDGVEYNVIQEGKDLSIPYAYADPTGIQSFTVYYRTNASSEWRAQPSNSFNTRTPDKFFVEIGADRYLNSEYIEYYVEAKNTFRTTTTPIHRVTVLGDNEFTGIRANLSDNEAIAGSVDIRGRAHHNGDVSIAVNGKPMETTRTLEQGAYLTMDINGLDGRKNAILANGELVQVFSRWYDVLPSRAIKIDSSLFTFNQNGDAELTINILAGTEIDAMDISPGTASDNFNVTNFNIVLPDGTILNTDGTVKSSDLVTLNSNKRELELHFTIPAEAMNANRVVWDTTTVADGVHTVTINAEDDSTSIQVVVDNTGPVIIADLPQHIDGTFTFAPQYVDASEVLSETLTLELDGTPLNGTTFNGSHLSAGTHTLKATVKDALGNIGTKTWTFTSSVNFPVISGVAASKIVDDKATLTATLSAGNGASVSFHEAQQLSVSKGIMITQGYGDDTTGAIAGALGTMTSENGSLPYQMYSFDVKQEDSSLRLSLDASTDYGKDVRLYVSSSAGDEWIPLHATYEDGKVIAVFETNDYIVDGKVQVMAQGRGVEMSPSQSASRASTVKNDYVWDGTGEPDQYDFSIAWQTDTQYYTQSYPQNFEILNSYIAANKERMDIRYVVHTGDIVDDIDEIYQWEYADEYMKILEDAGLPYGVLGGNHDIANHNGRYELYQQYFGADRFEGNGVYGESYKNNIGHYDLVTAGGQDLIFVYMSYDFDHEAATWINNVLAEHSDRIAVLNFHNYVRATSELDAAGQYWQDEVVAKNSNVKLVLGGHYHGAAINVSGFDDDGDGVQERTVYQMLTDYQASEEGGNAYYKTLYFDIANGKIYMNSYSPKLDDFNYYDTAKLDSYGIGLQASDMDIYELDLNFNLKPKTLTVNSIDAVLYSNTAMNTAAVEDDTASIIADKLSERGNQAWIAIAENNAGAAYSPLASFNNEDPEADTTAPALTAGKVSRTGSSKATVKFTADEAGSYYYAVVDRNASPPAIDAANEGIAYEGNREVTITLNGLTAGAKSIYVLAKDEAGNVSHVMKIDIPAYASSGNSDGDGSSGNNENNSTSSIISSTSGNTNILSLKLEASNDSSGIATASIDTGTLSELIKAAQEAAKEGKAVVVELVIDAAQLGLGANVIIPEELLSLLADLADAQLIVEPGLTLDKAAIDSLHLAAANEQDIQLVMTAGDISGLSHDAKAKVEGRPMYSFSILSGETTVTNLGEGQAQISVPYVLSPSEDPNAIVIYEIDEHGELQYVGGKYNPATRTVEFTSNHLTPFVVGYNKVTFNDVVETAWYYDAVTFMSARGITLGTGNGDFSPNEHLTRGQFLVMLMRAYRIDVVEGAADNFSDAGNTYYSNYLATAKQLGITTGVGDNKFAPESEITRQEMFTLVYRVLESLQQLPATTGGKQIGDYEDAEQISDYAAAAMKALVEAGVIHGSNGKINPANTTTRAELTQILYNLLEK